MWSYYIYQHNLKHLVSTIYSVGSSLTAIGSSDYPALSHDVRALVSGGTETKTPTPSPFPLLC